MRREKGTIEISLVKFVQKKHIVVQVLLIVMLRKGEKMQCDLTGCAKKPLINRRLYFCISI